MHPCTHVAQHTDVQHKQQPHGPYSSYYTSIILAKNSILPDAYVADSLIPGRMEPGYEAKVHNAYSSSYYMVFAPIV